MTGEHEQERRQQPRWTVRPGVECRVELRTKVRLVDISATGALLSTELPLPVGTAGHLRAAIGTTFTPHVEIRRQATVSVARPALALGAIFTGMDDRSRRSLEDFLKKASA